MFNSHSFLITFFLLAIISVLGGFYVYCRTSKFENYKNFEYGTIKTLKTIEEQQKENDEFMKEYNKYKKQEKVKDKNEVPLTWNENNTIESMKLKPCLADIPGSGTAPLWWYPNDKYDADNFKSVYYGDYYNPIYNYLGNAQEMFWDFKQVRNTYNVI